MTIVIDLIIVIDGKVFEYLNQLPNRVPRSFKSKVEKILQHSHEGIW
jgi:hypothetical protein